MVVGLADAKVPGPVAQRQASRGGSAGPDRLTGGGRPSFLTLLMHAPGRATAATVRFLRLHWLPGVYVLLAVGVSVQRLVLGKQNTFRIFSYSFPNLLAGANLYTGHPGQHHDFFRYSPTFALAFAPFSLPPEWLGLIAWNTVNALALYWAVRRLLPRGQAQLVLLLVMGDLARSMQSCESNALVTAIMIAAFLSYEGGRLWRGALAVVGGAAIKLFPVGAGVFAVLRGDRRRAFGALVLVGVVMVLLPALVIGPHALLDQYVSWFAREQRHAHKPMFSLMDLAFAWTGYSGPHLPFQLTGLAVLFLPTLVRRDAIGDPAWRRTLLCSLLGFSLLFNYGAEPPTFIIATTAIAIWFATGPRTVPRAALVALTLIFVTGCDLDLWPRTFRLEVMDPLKIRTIPVLLAWIAMQRDLLRWPRVAAAAATATATAEDVRTADEAAVA
jgi:hypothetical protein